MVQQMAVEAGAPNDVEASKPSLNMRLTAPWSVTE
jgi:hypothetical protein